MAGLNEKVVLAAVGELECVDGKPIEIPEEERIGEAVLISTQLAHGRKVGEALLGELIEYVRNAGGALPSRGLRL